MAKPENDYSFPEKQTWRTWEELLLACTIHRHGAESWSFLSAEIQKRSPNLRSLTASVCRHKYLDLIRRYTHDLALPESVAEISIVPWREKLRKLCVDELRREVEQYDLSISLLQSKVKRLEDEREMSLTELDTEIEKLDPDDKAVEKKERNDSGEPVSKPPIQSVTESIYPDPIETGSENAEMDEEVATEGNGSGGGDSNPVEEDFCKGSCESVEKESAAKLES